MTSMGNMLSRAAMACDHPDRLPVILLGGGGHARVLLEILQLLGSDIAGVVDLVPVDLGIPYLGGSYSGQSPATRHTEFAVAVGSIDAETLQLRVRLFNDSKAKGFQARTIIHPSAIVSPSAQIGEGSQIMAGAIIQAGAKIGRNCIINTGAQVDHDCEIGDHVHVAPGVVCCGGVKIGAGSHIGIGALLVQGAVIPAGSFIKAGWVMKP